MKVTSEMVERALSAFKGRRMVDPPWQESEAAMRAALEAVLTDGAEPEQPMNKPPFISTADLKGQRFIYSARTRAAKAAERAYAEWHERVIATLGEGNPSLQECWSYVMDRALEALTDGEKP
jgi:hypothetical protein